VAVDPDLGARERRLAKAAAFLAERGTVSRKELQAALDLSPATATLYLAEFIKRGQVRRIEPTAARWTHRFTWVT
jgi:predicted HTH transcriptional regulator